MSATSSAAVLAVHPEAVPDDPATLRWVVPADSVPFAGRVACAPGALGELLEQGVLATAACAPGAVFTTLGTGSSWARDGARVRRALQSALAEPDLWVCRPPDAGPVQRAAIPGDPADPEDIGAAVQRVLDGAAGDYVRSHGGRVELVAVRDGIAELRLSGACAHCPASAATLNGQLQERIRSDVPGVAAVRQTSARRPGWWRPGERLGLRRISPTDATGASRAGPTSERASRT